MGFCPSQTLHQLISLISTTSTGKQTHHCNQLPVVFAWNENHRWQTTGVEASVDFYFLYLFDRASRPLSAGQRTDSRRTADPSGAELHPQQGPAVQPTRGHPLSRQLHLRPALPPGNLPPTRPRFTQLSGATLQGEALYICICVCEWMCLSQHEWQLECDNLSCSDKPLRVWKISLSRT